jgi:hypothetical protein
MGDRHERLLLANPFAESTLVFSQVALCTVGGSMSRFQQCCSHPRTAFARFATQALACTACIAWAHPRPRCEMPVTGKVLPIHAHLGQDDLGDPSIDSGHPIHTQQGLGLPL